MRSLADFDVRTLEQLLRERGYPCVHAKRILRQFYRQDGRIDFEQLPIGKSLQGWLRKEVVVRQSRVVACRQSIDGTMKLLIGFDAGGTVECVLMPSHRPDRAAACVSSQVGCAMGCDFCASTTHGLERNLSSGEIVEQFLHLSQEASRLRRRLRSLVFMGMGEPMHNLEHVISAIHRIADRTMGGLGYRSITISTVGIVPGIERLAEANLGVHLALSLHAPDDATRDRLVPPNRRWRVADIIAAARAFQDRTGRPVNIEYCLLENVNDSDEQAARLANLLHGWSVHVNLIPYNPIGPGLSGAVYFRPSTNRIARFASILKGRGVVTHTRVTRGDSIAAACGQLRQRAALGVAAASLERRTARA